LDWHNSTRTRVRRALPGREPGWPSSVLGKLLAAAGSRRSRNTASPNNTASPTPARCRHTSRRASHRHASHLGHPRDHGLAPSLTKQGIAKRMRAAAPRQTAR
jgi:hypothetical protein